jgi:hypothetical protein
MTALVEGAPAIGLGVCEGGRTLMALPRELRLPPADCSFARRFAKRLSRIAARLP